MSSWQQLQQDLASNDFKAHTSGLAQLWELLTGEPEPGVGRAVITPVVRLVTECAGSAASGKYSGDLPLPRELLRFICSIQWEQHMDLLFNLGTAAVSALLHLSWAALEEASSSPGAGSSGSSNLTTNANEYNDELPRLASRTCVLAWYLACSYLRQAPSEVLPQEVLTAAATSCVTVAHHARRAGGVVVGSDALVYVAGAVAMCMQRDSSNALFAKVLSWGLHTAVLDALQLTVHGAHGVHGAQGAHGAVSVSPHDAYHVLALLSALLNSVSAAALLPTRADELERFTYYHKQLALLVHDLASRDLSPLVPGLDLACPGENTPLGGFAALAYLTACPSLAQPLCRWLVPRLVWDLSDVENSHASAYAAAMLHRLLQHRVLRVPSPSPQGDQPGAQPDGVVQLELELVSGSGLDALLQCGLLEALSAHAMTGHAAYQHYVQYQQQRPRDGLAGAGAGGANSSSGSLQAAAEVGPEGHGQGQVQLLQLIDMLVAASDDFTAAAALQHVGGANTTRPLPGISPDMSPHHTRRVDSIYAAARALVQAAEMDQDALSAPAPAPAPAAGVEGGSGSGSGVNWRVALVAGDEARLPGTQARWAAAAEALCSSSLGKLTWAVQTAQAQQQQPQQQDVGASGSSATAAGGPAAAAAAAVAAAAGDLHVGHVYTTPRGWALDMQRHMAIKRLSALLQAQAPWALAVQAHGPPPPGSSRTSSTSSTNGSAAQILAAHGLRSQPWCQLLEGTAGTDTTGGRLSGRPLNHVCPGGCGEALALAACCVGSIGAGGVAVLLRCRHAVCESCMGRALQLHRAAGTAVCCPLCRVAAAP